MCCRGHGGHPQGAGSLGDPNHAPKAAGPGEPPAAVPFGCTGGAEVPVLPRPLLGTGDTQTLCPGDKDCCLETLSSGQSLHKYFFPYQKQGAKPEVTPDASAAWTKSKSSHLRPGRSRGQALPFAPACGGCQGYDVTAQGYDVTTQGSHSPRLPSGPQHLVHAGTPPIHMLGLKAEGKQEGLASLYPPLPGFCLPPAGTGTLPPPAGSCFPQRFIEQHCPAINQADCRWAKHSQAD